MKFIGVTRSSREEGVVNLSVKETSDGNLELVVDSRSSSSGKGGKGFNILPQQPAFLGFFRPK